MMNSASRTNYALPFPIGVLASIVLIAMAAGCAGPRDDGSGVRDSSGDGRTGGRDDRPGFDQRNDPPFTAETRFAAGWLAENQGDARLAIRQYQEALKLDPGHVSSLYRLGVLHTRLQDKDKAVAAWKQYLRATGDSASGYANLGFCYEMFGDNESAEQAFRAGIGKEPLNRACRVNYGLMLARQARFDEAREQLAAVLTPAQVHYNLGSVFEQQGDAHRARGEYERALSLDPQFRDAKTRLEGL